MHIALEDEETQKKGITFVGYNLGNTHSVDRKIALQVGYLTVAMPMRFAGLHMCVDQQSQRVVATLASLVMGMHNTVRSRCHFGA